MRKRRLIMVFGTAAVLFVFWKLFLEGDEERIRRRLDRMGEIASKHAGEQPAVALGKARELSTFFTEDCEAADSTSGQVLRGSRELAQAIASAREEHDAATVEIEVEEIGVEPDGGAFTRVIVHVELPDGRTSPHDGTRADLSWVEQDGRWLISKAFARRPAPAR